MGGHKHKEINARQMPHTCRHFVRRYVTLWENVTCSTLQRYGKMFHGQTLKSATDDYDKRHVIAFRPISAAARSWSYDNI